MTSFFKRLQIIFIIALTGVAAFILFYISFGLPEQIKLFIQDGEFESVKTKTVTFPAYRVCKPGPLLGYPEPGSNLKNCLVIGDSVSVGYTPFLGDRLRDVCRVQRSPVDNKYGGARDSRYGRHCLPMFLRTTSGESVFYDVIIFNFGLHDIHFFYEKKFMDITLSEYLSNLAFIKESLGRTGAKLVFLTITPGAHNASVNEDIVKYNREAVKLMTTTPEVIVYDLYQTVINRCHGNTTDHFKKCGIFRPNDLHFNTAGSYEVSGYLAKLLKDILKTAKSSSKDVAPQVPGVPPNWVRCPGKKTDVLCPPGSSCCKIKYTEIGVGCCHLSNPVECGDDNHYCDPGSVCDPKCWLMKCFCHKNVTETIYV